MGTFGTNKSTSKAANWAGIIAIILISIGIKVALQ